MVQRETLTGSVQVPPRQQPATGTKNSRTGGKTRRNSCEWYAIVIAAVLSTGMIAGIVCAETSPESLATFGRNIYVSGFSSDPAVFFTGDEGTVTVYVTNGNANQSVTVNHASFGDKDIKLTSGTYESTSAIGPLQTRSYTFSVTAGTMEGTYYPSFSLSYFGSNTLWHKTDIQVDNTPLLLLVADKPDTFAQGREETISVQIANPRKNEVKNVILSVSAADAEITPSKVYIGTLASGASTTVNFTITPGQPATLALNVDYNNGDNVHTVAASLPVVFSEDKKLANPVLSNIGVTKKNGVYHVTGDVTNAGLLTANGVTVTSLSPATAEDPYRSYVIGALKPDDFGSFELTFTADSATVVPLQLSYKDKDGNVIASQHTVSLTGAVSSDEENAQPAILPVIIVIIVVALAGCGWYYLKKRKSR